MKIQAFKRINYYEGQVLTAADFRDEQDYHNGKRRLLNRCLHGSGVVCGLDVSILDRSVRIEPGLALDCCGREIYVGQSQTRQLDLAEGAEYLLIQYYEYESDGVPHTAGAGDANLVHTRITEGFQLSWGYDNPMIEHAYRDDRWSSCGRDHAIPLARLCTAGNRRTLEHPLRPQK